MKKQQQQNNSDRHLDYNFYEILLVFVLSVSFLFSVFLSFKKLTE